jgi:hypothetical protein
MSTVQIASLTFKLSTIKKVQSTGELSYVIMAFRTILVG